MGLFKQLSLKSKALFQLGFKQSVNFLLYQIGLRSGYFKLVTPVLNINALLPQDELCPNWFLALPEKVQILRVCGQQSQSLIVDADEILQKKIRFFGEEQKPLHLSPEKDPAHWSSYERGSIPPRYEDIKDIWEPARFNWAITLGKAYYLSGAEKYAEAFWQYFEEFTRSNPVNQGLNWTSAQEVALRLIALTVSAHLVKASPNSTAERLNTLSISIADHANRIPPTICYAIAQNNNHLLSEAVGLYTAAVFLPNHNKAQKWREKGLRWFNQAICTQIAEDGTYIQHSTNYHRMLLMLSLWMQLLLEKNNILVNDQVLNKLAAASEWLAVRLDKTSGQVPNLGHNDGSHILPFSNASYQSYRPVIQAASRDFRARPALESGPWDDLCLWLDIPIQSKAHNDPLAHKPAEYLILGDKQNWAALRAAHFTSRPAHADQLHVDIWHKGINIALDAGTYRYNAPPPWENSLSTTLVHNTITINDTDQMTYAGKFLWLDWAQAQVENISPTSITAIHSGYKRLGILHRRTLTKATGLNWEIVDELLPTQQPVIETKITLNWLLPDWPFEAAAHQVNLQSPFGSLSIDFEASSANGILDIYKSGASLLTNQKISRLGWYSPTYGVKKPALSVQYVFFQKAPASIKSTFHLPE